MNIYINGEEVVCENNFTINEEHLKTSSTILNKVYPKAWKEANNNQLFTDFYFPKDYSSCRIYKDNELIFSGVAKNSGSIDLSPYKPHFATLQILDYKTFLSEGSTLDFVISNKTIKDAIIQVINAISDYGFVVGNLDITDSSIIGAYSTLDKAPYDVFQYFAEISGYLWKTRTLSENLVAIDYYNPDDLAEKQIDYSQQYFEDNLINSINYSYSTSDYRNKQIILSNKVYASIDFNENIIANGYQTTFTASQEIGTLKNVYVNGTAKTIGTQTDKTLGIYADFYYSAGSTDIESSDNYVAGSVINVIYTPLVKGRQIAYNNNEISRIGQQLGTNGIIARYENRNDVLSNDELNKVAQTYIKYNSKPDIKLTIVSRKSNLFNIGDKVFFNISGIDDLKTDYLIIKKTTEVRFVGDEIMCKYTYEASSNFNVNEDVNYFDNQRRKANGNINQDEFITRNIDIENEFDIVFNNLTFTEITPVGDNILDSVLDSPLID